MFREKANANLQKIELEINIIIQKIQKINEEYFDCSSEEKIKDLYKKIKIFQDKLNALMIAKNIQLTLLKNDLNNRIKSIFKKDNNLVRQGIKSVAIIFHGNINIPIITNYYSRKQRSKKKKNKGFYLDLLEIGIYNKYIPIFTSEISMLSAALSSFEEVQKILELQECFIDIKTIRRIAKDYAKRVRFYQKANNYNFSKFKLFNGYNIVVAMDGGRIRIRKNKVKKTKKGRNKYYTDWREPKLLIIYVIGEDGKRLKTINPILDGTLNGPDAIFDLLYYYLNSLDLQKESQVLFIADGALWIWKRASKIFNNFPCKVYFLIDFYHAVGHLNNFAQIFNIKNTKKWLKKQKKRLLKGKVNLIIKEMKKLINNQHKTGKHELNYFIKNKNRMLYDDISKQHFPIGSGAIESAIRRVINLKLKGASIFWNEDTANEMLLLRCFYKAKRWNEMKDMVERSIFIEDAA